MRSEPAAEAAVRPSTPEGIPREAPRSRLLPVLVLVVLAPVVAEVLFGATPVSNPGALLPDLAVYGCGALLIREVVRRRALGWAAIALVGVVFGIIEEGLALGSLFNPALFNAGDLGGRALGVNWVWTVWTLGYHAIWSISIPILLVELLFPAQRSRPWLSSRGLWVAGILYVIGVAVLAAIFRFVVAPDFRPAPLTLVAAVLIAVALAALALSRRLGTVAQRRPERPGDVPSPPLVGLVGFVAAGLWFLPLVALPDRLRNGALALAPSILALAVAAVALALVARWSASRAWTDTHRLALAAGALLVSMLYGFFYVTAGSPVDRTGQGIACLVALVLLVLFERRLARRGAAVDAPHRPAEGLDHRDWRPAGRGGAPPARGGRLLLVRLVAPPPPATSH